MPQPTKPLLLICHQGLLTRELLRLVGYYKEPPTRAASIQSQARLERLLQRQSSLVLQERSSVTGWSAPAIAELLPQTYRAAAQRPLALNRAVDALFAGEIVTRFDPPQRKRLYELQASGTPPETLAAVRLLNALVNRWGMLMVDLRNTPNKLVETVAACAVYRVIPLDGLL